MDNNIPQNFVQFTFDFDTLGNQPVDDGILSINSSPGQKQKYCPKCRQWLPATTEYWHRNKMHEGGLHSKCKACQHDYYVTNHPHPCIKCHIQVAIHDHLCNECYKWKQNNPDVKYCPDCKQWLSTDRFGENRRSKDGLRRTCKSCRHVDYLADPERNKKVIQKRREDFLAKTPKEQARIRDHIRTSYRNRYAERKQSGMCYGCLVRPPEPGLLLCARCHASDKRYSDELRNEVFAAYGDKCAVCGETNPAFLSIDHINNDGASHRRTTGGGHRLYIWLRKKGFPQENFQLLCANHNFPKEGFQILCFNCNRARYYYGVCPHQK